MRCHTDGGAQGDPVIGRPVHWCTVLFPQLPGARLPPGFRGFGGSRGAERFGELTSWVEPVLGRLGQSEEWELTRLMDGMGWDWMGWMDGCIYYII